jgi:ABC-type long-subunit fatty acid transport system fused permease/ATPase subunit
MAKSGGSYDLFSAVVQTVNYSHFCLNYKFIKPSKITFIQFAGCIMVLLVLPSIVSPADTAGKN